MTNAESLNVILGGVIFVILCLLSVWRERALDAERKLAELMDVQQQQKPEDSW